MNGKLAKMLLVMAVFLLGLVLAMWAVMLFAGCTPEQRANCTVCRLIDGVWVCPAPVQDPNLIRPWRSNVRSYTCATQPAFWPSWP